MLAIGEIGAGFGTVKNSGQASGSPWWGQSFGYDGFGNLVSKTPTAGLQDLRDAPDDEGRPLNEAPLAWLDRGLAETAASRVESLRDYEFERGL